MPSFEVEEGGCRQRPPSILWFGGSCSSIVVLTTSLIANTFKGINSKFLRELDQKEHVYINFCGSAV